MLEAEPKSLLLMPKASKAAIIIKIQKRNQKTSYLILCKPAKSKSHWTRIQTLKEQKQPTT